MSTNFAKTLVWKHEYDVTLWRHRDTTPETNDHHMPLNETTPWKFSAYATVRENSRFWRAKPLHYPCFAGFGGTTISPNFLYGLVYIVVPAIALLCLGHAMNTHTWKLMTGCWKRHEKAARGYRAGCATLLEIFFQVPCSFSWQ